MLIGNTQAQSTIQTYLQAFQDGKHITPFLVLQGLGSVGKMTMITQILEQQMGQYRSTDAKIARNLSTVIGKSHSFKVEVATSDQQIVDKKTGKVHDNPGSRDLRTWLARAPLGDLKVVVIEDIDRMTISAANALLKEFEEPLPGRLIIGTVDAGKQLLDTIISRAFLVKFHTVSDEQMESLLPAQMGSEMRQFVLGLSRGRLGILQDLLSDEDQIQTLQQIILKTRVYMAQGGSIIDQMARAKQWVESGRSYDELLAVLLTYDTISYESQIIQARQRMMSNVNDENIIWSLMVEAINS